MPSLTLSPSKSSAAYGAEVDFAAGLSFDGSALGNRAVTLIVTNTDTGISQSYPSATDLFGRAAWSLIGMGAGQYDVQAVFDGSADATYASSNADTSLQINKALPNLQVSGGTYLYDGNTRRLQRPGRRSAPPPAPRSPAPSRRSPTPTPTPRRPSSRRPSPGATARRRRARSRGAAAARSPSPAPTPSPPPGPMPFPSASSMPAGASRSLPPPPRSPISAPASGPAKPPPSDSGTTRTAKR